MTLNLTHKDLVRLLRGCRPDISFVDILEQHGLCEYADGNTGDWRWKDEDEDCWKEYSEEELRKIISIVSDEEG